MDNLKRKDLQDIITVTEHAEVIAEDVNLDLESREAALRTFVTQNAQDIISLLYELQDWRNQSATGEGNHLLDKHARIIVEGFSDDNAADALSDALNKTSHYFSEQLDVSITLQQLTELKNGGHRAVLELHITPIHLKDRAHVHSLDIENKKFRKREFRNNLKKEEAEARHLVFDHFVARKGAYADAIPDYYLINLGDVHLMNYMIEKAFFKAGQPPSPLPNHLMVRAIKNGNEPEPSPS
ncbi:MAG TPA: hypothetical protein PLE43_01780 [Alphaproteobacteria bacterium]|mgnify:CR=1 FL=1|nr:hypothetical protein [Alphaproteobacteria bacterium]MCB9984797.1 hypothetical protein [Micavibrio sp.]HPQ50705.1 hypothetical protein [Alphaproteobacteria bacterium]HRK97188.1 hypothetical protein [Alphaproteobacteria bacterium]